MAIFVAMKGVSPMRASLISDTEHAAPRPIALDIAARERAA